MKLEAVQNWQRLLFGKATEALKEGSADPAYHRLRLESHIKEILAVKAPAAVMPDRQPSLGGSWQRPVGETRRLNNRMADSAQLVGEYNDLEAAVVGLLNSITHYWVLWQAGYNMIPCSDVTLEERWFRDNRSLNQGTELVAAIHSLKEAPQMPAGIGREEWRLMEETGRLKGELTQTRVSLEQAQAVAREASNSEIRLRAELTAAKRQIDELQRQASEDIVDAQEITPERLRITTKKRKKRNVGKK